MIINVPALFDGTPEEAAANYDTHVWALLGDGEMECLNCPTKPYHVAANYPCGVEPPRVVLTLEVPRCHICGDDDHDPADCPDNDPSLYA